MPAISSAWAPLELNERFDAKVSSMKLDVDDLTVLHRCKLLGPSPGCTERSAVTISTKPQTLEWSYGYHGITHIVI